jgi:cytoskeletal protein RodZ
MIESDNYAAISDQLYVLPFIRRYAEFLGLDSEEVAIRFVREVQRAESNVIKISEPIVDRRRGQSQPWIWIGAMIVIVIVAAIIFLRDHRRSMLSPSESVPNEPAQGSAASEKSAAPAAAQPPGPAIPAQAKPQYATQRSMPPKPAGVEQSVPNTE